VNVVRETTAATNLAQHVGSPLDRPLRVAVVGLGGRGSIYAAAIAAEHRGAAEVVQVAEPRPWHRDQVAASLGLGADAAHGDWHDLVAAERVADAVIIATQDRDHRPAIEAFAAAGYDILCEKPLAATERECEAAVAAASSANVFLGVCHVLRYTPNTRRILALIASGAIGDIVAIHHLEPIGWFHFAHSFVRGPWRRHDESGPMLLTKSCHDLDWLTYIVGAPVARVSSFGSRTLFTAANKPTEASDRCVTCAVEPECPYSAVVMYRAGLEPNRPESYFTRIVAPDMTPAAVEEALRSGPYGRCVFASDNDVVDHQVVSLEYTNGVTAAFTLSAATRFEDRHTSIFGSRGQITTDGSTVEVYDFTRRQSTTYDVTGDGSGHGGGDSAMLTAFLDALRLGEPDHFTSHGVASLATHRIAFAAERARTSGRVVEL
jgi:predicted dehydrogenase